MWVGAEHLTVGFALSLIRFEEGGAVRVVADLGVHGAAALHEAQRERSGFSTRSTPMVLAFQRLPRYRFFCYRRCRLALVQMKYD